MAGIQPHQLALEQGWAPGESFGCRAWHHRATALMDCLLTWRMALAQNLLRRGQSGIAELAKRVGYGSASTLASPLRAMLGCTQAVTPAANTNPR